MPFFHSLFSQVSILGNFWQEKINSQFLRWNLLLIIFQIAILFFKFNELPQQVPLYYSLPWGEEQLASAASLFLLPTFSIVILLINNLIATFFFKSIPLFSRLLVIFSLIFSLLSSISLTRIILLIS
ncbi:MAG: hypothetical protein PHP97_04210 [Candidatus Shapirobacteria bacterium]|nr:hypothetical protein [Candidatus Shapirobacteria bacterium]MDD3003051.1 hypothetical protein [Candidatus Shapirobacteria bacterium]MDD4383038.1 hypothetical protein [Candidatus Shapirobacteria bacterium]